MSTFDDDPDFVRRGQDSIERHTFEDMERVKGAGHIVKVRGTGTDDEEAHYMSVGGIGIRLPKGTNAEVMLVSGGADTNQKYAIVLIPRDKEHDWKAGQNGFQKWDDPARRVQWGDKLLHLTDKGVALGPNGEIELKDGKVYIRGELHVKENIYSSKEVHGKIAVRMPTTGPPNVPNMPDFEGDN